MLNRAIDRKRSAFFLMHATTITIQNTDVQDIDLKQVPRDTKVEFSTHVNVILYRCRKASVSENEIFAFVYRLLSAISTVTAFREKQFHGKRWLFWNAIQFAQKRFEPYLVLPANLLLAARH